MRNFCIYQYLSKDQHSLKEPLLKPVVNFEEKLLKKWIKTHVGGFYDGSSLMVILKYPSSVNRLISSYSQDSAIVF